MCHTHRREAFQFISQEFKKMENYDEFEDETILENIE